MNTAALIAAILLTVYTLATILMKFRQFMVARIESRKFVSTAVSFFKELKLAKLESCASQYKHSHIARLICMGTSEFWSEIKHGATISDAIKRADRASDRTRAYVKMDFEKGSLAWKLTAASSPLLAAMFSTQAAVILGLITVLPAVWMLIYADSRIKEFDLEMASSQAEFASYLEKNGEKIAAQIPKKTVT